jgi:chromosome segregation ATPase
MPLSAWLPLQSAAGAFREECSSLEHLVQELFADLERLSAEIDAKADELEEGRRHLAERGRQLAEQRKESARLCHQFEQQEAQLSETIAELKQLRAELASRPEPAPAADASPELEGLRQQITELQVQRGVLLERLEAAAAQARSNESVTPQAAVLTADSLDSLAEQLARQFAGLQQQLEASRSNPSAAAELEALKQELLERQETQLTKALGELRELRTELANRPETPPVDHSESTNLQQQFTELRMEQAVLLQRLEAAANQPSSGDAPAVSPQVLESLTDQFGQQFVALHEKIQALHQDPPKTAELDALRHEKLELESELELVRARSTELQETVSRQKRELEAQRLEVSDELKELRTLISAQAELFAQHEPASPGEPAVAQATAAEKQSPPAAASHEEPSSKPLDPVVNSVMAQFAKLQRDIAQRRKKK